MLVILASRFDWEARAFAQRQGKAVRVMTCEDLSLPGWTQYSDPQRPSSTVIGGKFIPIHQIDGVLTRLPYVTKGELVGIVEDEQNYVASEMMAFLVYWLSNLRVPVVNRPSPSCLCGPGWRPEKWVLTAAKLGIRTDPFHRDTNPWNNNWNEIGGYRELESVTVVGQETVGRGDSALAEQAFSLAKAAGTNLLTIRFKESASGPVFVNADVLVDLGHEEIAAALLKYFLENV